MMRMSHARSSGRAPATPPDSLCQIPAHPYPPSKKSLKNFVTKKLFFSGPRLAIFMFFFVSSMAPFFEVIIFLLFEPLGFDFEL